MKPIRARVTLRVHEGEIVASVSDGQGGISIHREGKMDVTTHPQPDGTWTAEATTHTEDGEQVTARPGESFKSEDEAREDARQRLSRVLRGRGEEEGQP